MPRSADLDDQINEAFAICFRGASGKLCLDYLATITTQRIQLPPIAPYDLTHLEGQRALFGIISKRVQHGKEKK